MRALSIALFAGMVGCASAQPVSAADAVTFQEKVLYSFCSQPNCTDGNDPAASLIDVNGTLYATTAYGGSYNDGTVFSIDPATGVEKVLYSFTGSGGDGATPPASLIQIGTRLYGTTVRGGADDAGTVFKINPVTGNETVLYSFKGGVRDGEGPLGGLIDINGQLYGTTQGGGSSTYGTVFSVDRKFGHETIVHFFASSGDGHYPEAGLIDVNGTLYGTTTKGGAGDYGTIYAVSPDTGAETVVQSFQWSDGAYPYDALLAVKDTLYGTAAGGGSGTGCNGPCGTVFSYNLSRGKAKVLYSFQGGSQDGAIPVASVIDVGKILYGTTGTGGGYGCSGRGCGTVFSLDRTTGTETVLHSFNATDGAGPNGLLKVNGVFYGTTESGGAYGYGTVFEIKP